MVRFFHGSAWDTCSKKGSCKIKTAVSKKIDRKKRPRLAVWKFASCDGCQLSLLSCEDEILQIARVLKIAFFAEASSDYGKGPYDLSLVEGSITTPADRERIQEVRRQSKHLVTIGACAAAGGIQALRNFARIDDYLAQVYARPEYISTLEHSTPISAHVRVDYELNGCPIDKGQLLEIISAYLGNRRPRISAQSVCMECKGRGTVCVMVAHKTPCMGPITHAGCGAICPSFHRGCYSCYGPKERANVRSWLQWSQTQLGQSVPEVTRQLRTYYAAAPPYQKASTEIETGDAKKK